MEIVLKSLGHSGRQASYQVNNGNEELPVAPHLLNLPSSPAVLVGAEECLAQPWLPFPTVNAEN